MKEITYPERKELLLHKECRPTPYQTGFEHYTYLHIYQPPYHIGSVDWWQYCQGNEDARKAERQEKP